MSKIIKKVGVFLTREEKAQRNMHLNSKADIIGEKIRELRTQKGLSLSKLGEKVGLNKSTLAGYELGHRFPSIDKLEILANTLETSTDYLLGLSPNPKPKDISQYLHAHDLHYDGEPLSEEQIATLNNLLKAFTNKN